MVIKIQEKYFETKKIVFLSHMFPNTHSPLFAPFMAERAKALSKIVNLDIVAPVSYFPFIKKKLPPHKEKFNELEVYHPRYIGLPSNLWNFRWLSYFIMLKLLPRKILENCSIMHIEWIYPDAYAAVRFAKKNGIKTVGVVHGNEAIEYYGPTKLRKKYRKVLAALDRIIVVSKDLKNKLIKEYGVISESITVIHNGINKNEFKLFHKDGIRSRLGLPKGLPIGICVARLSEEKNIDILIKAVSLIKEKIFLIYIIGDGPLRDELRALIYSLGIENKVVLVGPVSNEKIALWLNASDFFCLPSQREGCPVVIHEALACGVPIVSTTVGAIPDLIYTDEYGILCPPSDSNAFAEIIEKAMLKRWDNEKISIYGKKFTWEKVAEQTVNIFHEVLL